MALEYVVAGRRPLPAPRRRKAWSWTCELGEEDLDDDDEVASWDEGALELDEIARTRQNAEFFALVEKHAGFAPEAVLRIGGVEEQDRAAGLGGIEERGEVLPGLAISLERFDGGDRDEAGATVAYQRSCDGNYADGCFNLGYAYERGESGLSVDKPRGRALIAKACKLDKKDACPVVRKLCLDEPAPCTKLGPEFKK